MCIVSPGYESTQAAKDEINAPIALSAVRDKRHTGGEVSNDTFIYRQLGAYVRHVHIKNVKI